MSIEEIAMEHCSAPNQIETVTMTQVRTCHAVFHYFLSDDIKQNAATTTVHSKITIELLKKQNIISDKLSTICVKAYGCSEH